MKSIEQFIREIPTLIVVALVAGTAVLLWILTDGDRETVGLFLGGAALVYALFQFGDAGTTLDGLEVANKSLDELADRLDSSVELLNQGIVGTAKDLEAQLSTKRLEVFPNFMPAIVDLLKSATEEIVICCDHPAYAVFSDAKAHEDYRSAIRGRIDKGIPVSLLCNNPHRGAELRKAQIELQGGWEEVRRDPRMLDFIGRNGDGQVDREAISEGRFIEMLEAADAKVLAKVFGVTGSEVFTDQVLPLYFWMVDGRKAVFALAALTRGALEVGFATEDPGLTGALQGIFRRYQQVVGRGRGLPITGPA